MFLFLVCSYACNGSYAVRPVLGQALACLQYAESSLKRTLCAKRKGLVTVTFCLLELLVRIDQYDCLTNASQKSSLSLSCIPIVRMVHACSLLSAAIYLTQVNLILR